MTSNNISPKSYLNKNVFDNVSNIKKRGKITDDEFKMIKMEEYEHVINFQYKVSQLKQLCVHHKLRKTGNKEELINRIYNYLKYSLYAIKIQKVYKGRILRSYLKYTGPALKNRSICINDTDFATLEPINEIPYIPYLECYQRKIEEHQASNHDLRLLTHILLGWKLYCRYSLLSIAIYCCNCWHPFLWY